MSADVNSHALVEPLREAQLVQQAVAGDEQAFASLYEAYVGPVFRFIYFRTGDRQAAEDLTSQTFLKAWDNLHSCHKRGAPFGRWLFRIARNTVIDHYRGRRPEARLQAASAAGSHDEALEAVEHHHELQRLRRALAQLTAEQRDVLTLKFVEGLSTQETAQALGKRPGAIRALQMRALQALAHLLGSERQPRA
jgi:RNA polymerase sigma-70 factor, ECF subfamily